jgi:hypothetical protein
MRAWPTTRSRRSDPDRLKDVVGVSEKKMLGGLAFLTHGNMTVGVHGDDLIARIDPPPPTPR